MPEEWLPYLAATLAFLLGRCKLGLHGTAFSCDLKLLNAILDPTSRPQALNGTVKGFSSSPSEERSKFNEP